MWNGLKISEVFFEEYGLPMLEKDFPEYKDQIAAGLAGQTSEAFGYESRSVMICKKLMRIFRYRSSSSITEAMSGWLNRAI